MGGAKKHDKSEDLKKFEAYRAKHAPEFDDLDEKTFLKRRSYFSRFDWPWGTKVRA